MGFSSPLAVLPKTTDVIDDDTKAVLEPGSLMGLPAKKPWMKPKVIDLSSDKDAKGSGKMTSHDKKDPKCKKTSGADGARTLGTVSVMDDAELSDGKPSPQKAIRAPLTPEELAKQMGRHIGKWAMELPALKLYQKSCDISARNLEAWSNRLHVAYLESVISNKTLGLNIRSVSSWRKELEGLRIPHSK